MARKGSTALRGIQFSEDDFMDDFDLKRFVEARTRIAVSQASSETDEGGPDPKHIKVIMENYTRDLEELRTKVEARIQAKEAELAAEEPLYNEHMNSYVTEYEHVHELFADLDMLVDSVSDGAVRIGGRIEEADRQRSKAIEAKALLNYFAQLNSGDRSLHDSLFSERPHDAAMVVKVLKAITGDLHMVEIETAKKEIETYHKSIAEDILDEFKAACGREDMSIMAKCARTLSEFDGGQACVEWYVSNHSFFAHIAKSSKLSSRSDADRRSVAEREISLLFKKVSQECFLEHEVVQEVFPGSEDSVMQRFISKLFEKIGEFLLQPHILGPALVLSRLETAPTYTAVVTYLRILDMVHRQLLDLVLDLEQKDLGNAIFVDGPQEAVDKLLHRYQQSYIECELCYLNGVSEVTLHDALKDFTLDNKSGFIARHRGKNKGEVALPAACVVSTATVNTILSVHSEAVQRAVGWSRTSQGVEDAESLMKLDDPAPNYVKQIVGHLLNSTWNTYFLQALDVADDSLPPSDPKPPNSPVNAAVRYFEAAAKVNQATVALQDMFTNIVIPNIASSANVRTFCTSWKADRIKVLEDKLISSLESCVKSCVNYLQRLLAYHQTNDDFKPKADAFLPTMESSAACKAACAFLRELALPIQNTFDEANQKLLLGEIGLRFHRVVLTHVRKYHVNSMGALNLLKDVGEYQACVKEFGVPAVNEAFELVREVGNLYLIQPQNIRALTEEGRLATMERSNIMKHIQMRSDFKAENISVMFRDR